MSEKYPREALPPGISDREARQLESKLRILDFGKQFLDLPRPASVAQLAEECRAFQRHLIDGKNKVLAIAIGRDVTRRWWDCIRLFGGNEFVMPPVREINESGAFADVITNQECLDQVKAAVDAALCWCKANESEPQPAPTAKKGRGRKPDPEIDPKADKRLCADWKAAKGQGATRGAFARDKGISVNDLIAAMNREKYRRQRDAE